MQPTNQTVKLFQVLSKALERATVAEIIEVLSPMAGRPAAKRSAPPTKKQWEKRFAKMLEHNIRATKPDYLKNEDA